MDLKDIRIASLGGQLRWRSETGPVVGDLSVPRVPANARPTAYPSEHQFTICCSVSHEALSRLEAERGGAIPTFYVDLAGTWAIGGSVEPIQPSAWPVVVPADMWLAMLSASGYDEFDVVELRRVLKEGGRIQGAVDYLNAARRLVSEDPPRAIGKCRLLIEGLDTALKEQGHGNLKEYLTACTDKERGKEYGRIVSAVKQLSSFDHHHFGQGTEFTRHEALALVRICEALLLMVGELARRPSGAAEDPDQG